MKFTDKDRIDFMEAFEISASKWHEGWSFIRDQTEIQGTKKQTLRQVIDKGIKDAIWWNQWPLKPKNRKAPPK